MGLVKVFIKEELFYEGNSSEWTRMVDENKRILEYRIEGEQGNFYWYSQNRLHRLDGPARIQRHPNGTVVKEWRIEGVAYSFTEWFVKTLKREVDLTEYLLDSDSEIRDQAEKLLKFLKNNS